jgi:hypothetical protein
MVHALDKPGMLKASFIWLISFSWEIWSGVMCRNIALAHSGAQEEY